MEYRFNHKAEVHNLIEDITADLGEDSEEARRNLMWFRSHLWSELNTLTNVGRLISTGQGRYEKVRSGWKRLARATGAPADPEPRAPLPDRVVAAVAEGPGTASRVIARVRPFEPGETMAAVRRALLAAEAAGVVFRSAQGRWTLASAAAAR